MNYKMLVFTLAISAAALSGCGDLTSGTASLENVVDTVTMYALTGTPVAAPSGFDLVTGTVVRTEQSAFDFALDMDAAGRPTIYPAKILGISSPAGLLKSDVQFDSLEAAPEVYFDSLTAVPLTSGSVFMARSRITTCPDGASLPYYGKFGVLSVDSAARSVTMQALVDLNCGFRGLLTGLPTG
jgi:hypothetical protein